MDAVTAKAIWPAQAGRGQGATTGDEPLGRNPETSEATAPNALKAKLDLAPRSADLIEASGHIVPRAKAGHMTAPSQCVKSTEKALATRAVPHMGARSHSLPNPLPLARALHNALCGSEVRFRAFFERPRTSRAKCAGPLSRRTDGVGLRRSCRSSRGRQHRPSFEVHGKADQAQMGLVARQAQITGARPAVAALEAREDLLDRCAALSHTIVEALLRSLSG